MDERRFPTLDDVPYPEHDLTSMKDRCALDRTEFGQIPPFMRKKLKCGMTGVKMEQT